MTFQLNPRLIEDCHLLGTMPDSRLLLLNNAYYPWFILVPETDTVEFHQLPETQQIMLLKHINRISGFIEQHFSVDKINTACIGNIVRQMHIHIVGRSEQDPAWPGVVWGQAHRQAYGDEQLAQIKRQLNQYMGAALVTAE